MDYDNDRSAWDYGEPMEDELEDELTYEPSIDPEPPVLEDGWIEEEPAQSELSPEGKTWEQKMIDKPTI